MGKQFNVEKFLKCNKHCTVECPYNDDSAMKRICDDIEKWKLIPKKPIDIITNADYKRAGNLCKKCDAFSPESDNLQRV